MLQSAGTSHASEWLSHADPAAGSGPTSSDVSDTVAVASPAAAAALPHGLSSPPAGSPPAGTLSAPHATASDRSSPSAGSTPTLSGEVTHDDNDFNQAFNCIAASEPCGVKARMRDATTVSDQFPLLQMQACPARSASGGKPAPSSRKRCTSWRSCATGAPFPADRFHEFCIQSLLLLCDP